MMDLDRFWSLIERTRQRIAAAGQDESGPTLSDEDALTATLSELSADEIIQFDQRFSERMLAAYHWDLWAAYYIIEESCAGYDAFEHFRAELILEGREVFEAALANADSLANVTPLPWGDEGLIYAPSKAYEQKTGESLPCDSTEPPFPDKPAGQPWVEEDLPQRFPRLWASFGDGLAASPQEEQKITVSNDAPHVRIVRGRFQNYEGRLIEVDDATDRVFVVLDIFGSPTKVELQRADIQLK